MIAGYVGRMSPTTGKGGDTGSGGGGVFNAMLWEDGTPILWEDGNYIQWES